MTFTEALRELATLISRGSQHGEQPEDRLKLPVQGLLRSQRAGLRTVTEVRIADVGRPDVGVILQQALCGYVELKEPGKGANPTRFRGADKAQWERFKALPNIMYTDGVEWALYRGGERVGRVLKLETLLDGQLPDTAAQQQLRALFDDFLTWEPIVPSTPKALAEALAPLSRMLRDNVADVLRDEDSVLRELSLEIRQALFPNANHRDFADTYAQTLTYALLLARLLGEEHLTAESAVRRLASGHRLLSEVLGHMAHQNARAEVATAVDVLERVIAAVDPARLARRGDPWIYFYEHFLEAYDPKLRKDRGVYYTPAEVVQCQVRLTDELLRQSFGRSRGYADEGVIFLDPAAGTAAYPLAMIEHALAETETSWGAGMVATAAGELAKNVHAFEILVGPYAVAHLRISEALRAAGGSLPDDGLPVYLTDTLESPNAAASHGGIFSRAMTDEHRRATRIKREVQVLVCMGNPPYDREQSDDSPEATPTAQRKGGWVRFGDREAQPGRAGAAQRRGDMQATDDVIERPILEDFLQPAREAGQGVHLKNLYNDYVYFWRWALWKLFENSTAAGPGIVSFITASSYLRGPGFVGMRQKMREAFDELWIIDLGGDNLGARKTPNVFNIQTPVAIAIGVRHGAAISDTPAVVRYTRIDADNRDAKLERVGSIGSFADMEWQDCFSGWMQPFLPQGQGDYFGWPLLTALFPWQHSGVQYKRSWPIAESRLLLDQRWDVLTSSPIEERAALLRETSARRVSSTYEALFGEELRIPAISSLTIHDRPERIVRYGYRSFDRQWAIADTRVMDRARPDLWAVDSTKQIFITSLMSSVLGIGPAATVTSHVPDLHHFCGRGGKDVIPLWRDVEARDPNVTYGLLDRLSENFGYLVAPEDLFAYAYAMLGSPAYVERFSEELTVPGPRLPLTRDAALFSEAVAHGRALIHLHTYSERFVPDGGRVGQVLQGSARLLTAIPDTVEGYPEDFAYDPETEILRVGSGEVAHVTTAVYMFSVSGFQVVRSWLAYRMKLGAGRRSSALDEIRPQQWSAALSHELMELLWVLEHTVARFPALTATLDRIVAGPLFRADELPKSSTRQRQPPMRDEEFTEEPVQPDLGFS